MIDIQIPPAESCENCKYYKMQFIHKCFRRFKTGEPCPAEVKCGLFEPK